MASFEKPFSEADEHWLLYASSYYLVKGMGKVALGFKVRGAENIPKEGRAIIAPNHRHWLDIFLGPIAIPKRHVTTIAKKEVYDTPILGSLFHRWGTISVNRDNPEIETTRRVLKKLEQERLVAVMPEGHRYQENTLGDMRRGVAMWARLGNAPTIPAAIRGVDSFPHALLHRSAEVNFGAPIAPPQSKKDEETYLEELRNAIQSLYDQQ
jgi:1-acyl-sn-glycerol-3-phosphate acyltransferase